MLNILGMCGFDANDAQRNPDWTGVLSQVDSFVHLYGKAEPRRARKMGHVNFVGKRMEAVIERTRRRCAFLGLVVAYVTNVTDVIDSVRTQVLLAAEKNWRRARSLVYRPRRCMVWRRMRQTHRQCARFSRSKPSEHAPLITGCRRRMRTWLLD